LISSVKLEGFQQKVMMMDKAMQAAMQQVSLERAHMVAVRASFGAALHSAENDERAYGDFYGACADYLEFIMERFHAQDQASLDMLRAKVPKDNIDAHRLIDNIDATFDTSREEIEKLVDAMKRFKAEELAGQKTFEQAGRAYVDYCKTQLSKIKHSLRPLSEEYITPEEFDRSSFVTPNSIKREQELFARVGDALPEGVPFKVEIEPQKWRSERLRQERAE